MFIELNKIEVFVLYCSSLQSETISFTEIFENKNSLDSKDYEPSMYWGILGGIEIVINNYNTIFRSTNFQYLVKATSFLIHSLYWIDEEHTDWFDIEDAYSSDVVVYTTSDEVLRLEKISEEKIALSFISPLKNNIRKRGERYFEKIEINKDVWCNAVNLALHEYFEVTHRIIKENPNDNISKTIKSYYDVWKSINNKATQ